MSWFKNYLVLPHVHIDVCVHSVTCVRLFVTSWTVAHRAPLSRQEYWSGLPFPSLELPNPGIEPRSPASPALAGEFFSNCTTWEAHVHIASPGENVSNDICSNKYFILCEEFFCFCSVYLTDIHRYFSNFVYQVYEVDSIIPPFYRWENWDSEWLTNLSKITELKNVIANILNVLSHLILSVGLWEHSYLIVYLQSRKQNLAGPSENSSLFH